MSIKYVNASLVPCGMPEAEFAIINEFNMVEFVDSIVKAANVGFQMSPHFQHSPRGFMGTDYNVTLVRPPVVAKLAPITPNFDEIAEGLEPDATPDYAQTEIKLPAQRGRPRKVA